MRVRAVLLAHAFDGGRELIGLCEDVRVFREEAEARHRAG